MSKKISVARGDTPTLERMRHSAFNLDVLTGPGGLTVARHRTRPVLTPASVRQDILNEVEDKPDAIKERSLRRRLTVLDRALTDGEAAALDRISTCMIGLGNIGCVNYQQAAVRTDPFSRVPFGEAKRQDIAAMATALKRLSAAQRMVLADLAERLSPTSCDRSKPETHDWLASIKAIASAVESAYRDWDRSRVRH